MKDLRNSNTLYFLKSTQFPYELQINFGYPASYRQRSASMCENQ